MELVKLVPAVKDYIWGGTYFKQYNKGIVFDRVSECWELSLREDAPSIIASGRYLGKPLCEVVTKEQVHPSDDYALKYENSFGKSEMWHIISADEGSGLYVGLNNDYSKEDIEKALKEGKILEYLNFYKVKPGETYVIKNPTKLQFNLSLIWL